MNSSLPILVAACVAMAGSAAAATNILPGSGATVTGSSLYPGFNESAAAGNLINGTSNETYPDGDTRWVFADGQSGDETLTVDLAAASDVFSAGFEYNGQDRVPSSFEVLTSMDGINFTVVAGPSAITDFGSPGIYDTEYSFAPVLAKYVEIDFGTGSQVYSGCTVCGGGGDQGAGVYQLQVYAVPEPAVWALMLVGLGGIGACLRGRRHRPASA